MKTNAQILDNDVLMLPVGGGHWAFKIFNFPDEKMC